MQYHKSEKLRGSKWLGIAKIVWMNDSETFFLWFLRHPILLRDDGNWFGQKKQ